MPSYTIRNWPVLRLLIPFIVGVSFGDYLFFKGAYLPTCSIGWVVLFSSITLIGVYCWIKRYAFRWVFGALACFFFLLFGICWSNLRLQQSAYEYPVEETIYRAVITDRPEEKEKSILCRAHVVAQYDSSATISFSNSRQVLLYFPLDSVSGAIRNGDELLLSARLSLPKNNNNPDEFDYARYLKRKGVYATAFVPSGKWRVVNHHSAYSVRQRACDTRENILNTYRTLGFDGENLAVLSALTVGYKGELTEDIRESFSVSGVSHVLAVSGLHVGFLYVLLLFFFKRVPGNSLFASGCRIVITILFLWGFAFVAGLSPSVVRSVIMFSLLAISESFFKRRNVSLNTLAVAAMGMVLYNPGWIFDVGFQLSFLAVAAIIIIQPWMYARVTFRNTMLDKLWKVITVSVSAQIAVAPLILLYFSRFSVHFLLTNILVIPLVTIIMYGAGLMLVLSFVPYVNMCVALILKGMLTLLLGIVRGVEQLPLASVDDVWVSRMEVFLFYTLLILLVGYIYRRSARQIIAILVVLCSISVYHLYVVQMNKPKSSVVFYNVRNCPVVHCIATNKQSWLAYADTVPDEKRLKRAASSYWNRLRLPVPIKVTTDYADDGFMRQHNMLLFGDVRVCIINDNFWNNKVVDMPFPVDYIYLCKGYEGRIGELSGLFSVRHIVFDSSFSAYRCAKLQEECRQLGIPYTSLLDNGAYKRLI